MSYSGSYALIRERLASREDLAEPVLDLLAITQQQLTEQVAKLIDGANHFIFLNITPENSSGIAESIEDLCLNSEANPPFKFLTYEECLNGFKDFSPEGENDVIFIDLTDKVDPEEWKLMQNNLIEMVDGTKRKVIVLRDPSKPNFAFQVNEGLAKDSSNVYVAYQKLSDEQQANLIQLLKLDSDTSFEIIRTALKYPINTSVLLDLLIALKKEDDTVQTDLTILITSLREMFARHFSKKLVGHGVDHNLLFQTLLTTELLGGINSEHEFLQLLNIEEEHEKSIMQALIANEIILVSYTQDDKPRYVLNPVINTLRYLLFSYQLFVDTGMNMQEN